MLPFYAYLLAHSMNLLVQESMLELFSFRCQTVKLCLTRVFHTNFDFFWGGDSSPPKGEGGRGISDLQIYVVLRLTASLLAGRLKKGTFPTH